MDGSSLKELNFPAYQTQRRIEGSREFVVFVFLCHEIILFWPSAQKSNLVPKTWLPLVKRTYLWVEVEILHLSFYLRFLLNIKLGSLTCYLYCLSLRIFYINYFVSLSPKGIRNTIFGFSFTDLLSHKCIINILLLILIYDIIYPSLLSFLF